MGLVGPILLLFPQQINESFSSILVSLIFLLLSFFMVILIFVLKELDGKTSARFFQQRKRYPPSFSYFDQKRFSNKKNVAKNVKQGGLIIFTNKITCVFNFFYTITFCLKTMGFTINQLLSVLPKFSPENINKMYLIIYYRFFDTLLRFT